LYRNGSTQLFILAAARKDNTTIAAMAQACGKSPAQVSGRTAETANIDIDIDIVILVLLFRVQVQNFSLLGLGVWGFK
jgi:hypothetical protein